MANSYVIISNTGNINDGLKLIVKGGTWRPSKPAPDEFTGVAGDSNISLGAECGKWVWGFTGQFQKVGASGYASKSTVETWATTMTAAQRLLKFQDVDGTVWDALWVAGYGPRDTAYETGGNAEWYEVDVRLKQK